MLDNGNLPPRPVHSFLDSDRGAGRPAKDYRNFKQARRFATRYEKTSAAHCSGCGYRDTL